MTKGPNEENTEWVRSVQMSGEKWIVAGDFNAHSPLWDKDSVTITSRRFVENIVDSSLCLLNDGSITRIPDIINHRASALDLTFISPILVPHCSWGTQSDTLGSDHLPIVITLYDKPAQINKEKDIIPKYNYNNADWDKFHSYLRTQETSSLKDIDFINDS